MEAQSLTAERLNQQPASPSHLIHFSGCFNEFHKAFLLFHKTDQSFFYEIIIRPCSDRGRVKGRGHSGSKQSDISLNKSDIPDIFRWIPDIRDPELLLTVSPRFIPGQVLTLLNYPKIEKESNKYSNEKSSNYNGCGHNSAQQNPKQTSSKQMDKLARETIIHNYLYL